MACHSTCVSVYYREMGFFDGWRKNHGPTLYGSLKTAVTSDVLETGLIYCGVILAFSFFIVLPGFKGKQVSADVVTIHQPLYK